MNPFAGRQNSLSYHWQNNNEDRTVHSFFFSFLFLSRQVSHLILSFKTMCCNREMSKQKRRLYLKFEPDGVVCISLLWKNIREQCRNQFDELYPLLHFLKEQPDQNRTYRNTQRRVSRNKEQLIGNTKILNIIKNKILMKCWGCFNVVYWRRSCQQHA